MSALSAAVLAAVLGAVAGAVSRVLLSRLRRGTVVRPGPLELASALNSGVGVASTFDTGPWPLVLWVGILAVPLAAVDLRHHRLPDALTLPAVPVTLAVCALDALWGSGGGNVGRAALAGALVGGLFLTVTTVAPAALGRGDAKLAFSIGIALGYLSWPAVLLGLFAGFLAGSLTGLAALVTRRIGLRSAMPFGPALLLGCWLVLALPPVLRWFSPVLASSVP